MKLLVSDIKRVDWLSNLLPPAFTTLTSDKYFIIFYDPIEKDSLFEIKDYEVAYSINDIIFKTTAKKRAQNFAVFKEPFDTRTIVFYMMLKSFIKKSMPDHFDENLQKLDNLFLYYKEEDDADLKIMPVSEQTGSFEINVASDLETALLHFVRNKQLINPLITITEIVNTYFKNNYEQTLYGAWLKKIVQSVNNRQGGLIPEENGRMQYMIIGERSWIGINDDKLKLAKDLLRKGISAEQIYKETDWFLNEQDSRWRKRISDKDYVFTPCLIRDNQEKQYQLYYPADCPISEEDLIKGIEKDNIVGLINKGYNGKLSDFVKHDLLFKAYPEIADLKLFYYMVKKEHIFDAEFYFSPQTKCIVMYANPNQSDPASDPYTLLHEIQHCIQHKEDFANGGNQFLAALIMAGGGSNLRDFINITKILEKKFCEKINDSFFKKFQELFINNFELIFGNYADQIKMMKFETLEQMQFSCGNCTMIIFSILSQIEKDSEAEALMSLLFEFDVFEREDKELLLSLRDNSRQSRERIQILTKKGWTDYEIRYMLHHFYQGLIGEYESRETATTSKIDERLINYFNYLTSEDIEKKYMTVYFNREMLDDIPTVPITFGIETTKDKKYVIHMNSTYNSEPYLHELGHIVVNEIKNYKFYKAFIDQWMLNKKEFPMLDEFMVEAWLCYLIKKDFDKKITLQLNVERNINAYDSLYEFFDYMLFDENIVNRKKVNAAIEYLKHFSNE